MIVVFARVNLSNLNFGCEECLFSQHKMLCVLMHYESTERRISVFQDKLAEDKLMSHHSRGMMPLPRVAKPVSASGIRYSRRKLLLVLAFPLGTSH